MAGDGKGREAQPAEHEGKGAIGGASGPVAGAVLDCARREHPPLLAGGRGLRGGMRQEAVRREARKRL